MGMVNPVTPEQVGAFYDFITPYFKSVWGENIHYGCWESPDDTNEQAHQRLSDHVIDRVDLKAGERLLDVGCGVGRPAMDCVKRTGGSVLGISISASQVLQAKQAAASAGLQERARFQRVNALDMPFDDSSFDAAMAIESFIYMPRDQVLKEIARVLRPGGRVVFTDIIEVGALDEQQLSTFLQAFALYSVVTLDDYRRDLAAVGLEIDEVFDISAKVTPFFKRFYDATIANADTVKDIYGKEVFDNLVGALQVMMGAYEGDEQGFGYVIVTARKPA
ncbi:MAG: 27-O-demethylrifamycin SV methyltransferase [Haliangiales bacterium]